MLPNNAALRLHILIDGVADIPLAEEIKCRRGQEQPNAQPPRVALRSPKNAPPGLPTRQKSRLSGSGGAAERSPSAGCGILIAEY